MPNPIDAATLQMALVGYQAELARIEQKMAEIRGLSGGRVDPVVARKAAPKRSVSVATRARMAAAQKKRWAASKAPKAKRRISEEGLKRIIAATKKRWAAKRAAAAKEAAAKVAVRKAAPRKSAPAKAAKAPAKRAARKPASVTVQPTGAGESAKPEVAAQ